MKRRLIYCPEVNRSSVVLLFEKGDGGMSWGVRDYSQPGAVAVRYAREFDSSLAALSQGILHSVEAPAVSTSDLEFWHRFTVETNRNLNVTPIDTIEQHSTVEAAAKSIEQPPAEFGMIDRDRMMSLPKARKAGDMRRILHSPNSEDWVTWNAFALVQKLAPETWWEHLVGLAKRENPNLQLPNGWAKMPTVTLWRGVPAPRGYADDELRTTQRLIESAVGYARRLEGESPYAAQDQHSERSVRPKREARP
jgi:hypothetical protein